MPTSKPGYLAAIPAALLVGLAGCGAPSGEPEGANIECAIGPGSEFSNVCVAEQISADAFVIHHPDGGFRRFVLSEEEGQTIAAADGAEPIIYERAAPETDLLEFGMAVDRYRLDMGFLNAASDE